MSIKKHNCRDCAHFLEWMDAQLGNYTLECLARPHMANLVSFPFEATICQSFESREESLEKGRERLREAFRKLERSKA